MKVLLNEKYAKNKPVHRLNFTIQNVHTVYGDMANLTDDDDPKIEYGYFTDESPRAMNDLIRLIMTQREFSYYFTYKILVSATLDLNDEKFEIDGDRLFRQLNEMHSTMMEHYADAELPYVTLLLGNVNTDRITIPKRLSLTVDMSCDVDILYPEIELHYDPVYFGNIAAIYQASTGPVAIRTVSDNSPELTGKVQLYIPEKEVDKVTAFVTSMAIFMESNAVFHYERPKITAICYALKDEHVTLLEYKNDKIENKFKTYLG